MLCETAREQLNTLSDGERLENTRVKFAVWRHCLHCTDCQNYRRQLRRLRQTASRLPANLPDALRQRVLSRLLDAAPDRNLQRLNSQRLVPTPKRTFDTKEIAMKKRLIIAASVFVVTLTVSALSAKITNPFRFGAQSEDWRERDRQHVAQVNAQINRPEDNAAFLAQAKEMRAHWKSWAMQHQEDLKQMLYAPVADHAALMRVYRVLPSTLPPDGEGLTQQDLNKPKLQFTWQMVTKFQTGQENVGPSILADYVKFHDICLSSSMKTGATKYDLWASGRVTETILQETIFHNGDTSFTPQTHEICPPYEEIIR